MDIDTIKAGGKAGLKAAGTAAAVTIIDQGKVARKLPPAAWKMLKELPGLARDGLSAALAHGKEWYELYGTVFIGWVVKKLLLCLAVMCSGIIIREYAHAKIGWVVGAFGAVCLQVVLVFLWTLGNGLAYVMVGTVKTVNGKVGITVIEEKTATDLHAKYKQGFSLLVLIAAALLPFVILVSWESLFATVIMAALAMPAILATIKLGDDTASAMKAIRKVSVIATVLFIAMFLIWTFLPDSFGSWSMGTVDAWFHARNQTEWTIMVIALGLTLLLVASIFAKDKERKAAFRQAFKWLLPISAILIGFLFYRGSLKKDELMGKTSTEQVEQAKTATTSASTTNEATSSGPPPSGLEFGKGTTLSPPPDRTVTAGSPAKTVERAPVTTVTLPPPEPPREYTNLKQGLDELSDLGY